jgi:hypothetical protein
MITRRRYERLNDQAYALYVRLDSLWADLYLKHEHSPRRTRLAVLAQTAYDRYQRRLNLPAVIVPPAPKPEYGIVPDDILNLLVKPWTKAEIKVGFNVAA